MIGKVGFSLLSDRSSEDGGELRLHRVAEFAASGHLLLTGGAFALWSGGYLGGGALMETASVMRHGFKSGSDVAFSRWLVDGERNESESFGYFMFLPTSF
ncbi:hypothetical protein RchiOBHm_Chr5g0069801 [Rosa chinensis]|uniref:Uncharacterized protein n=1 Tax=Rosa chinensis TaxID=74649 RepID=A0A2P6QK25_ROSCH|nr:hypothetical protein RchiOBHm_Chr5g0069801 [Rosa chinensis]